MYRIYLYKAGLFACGTALLVLGIIIVVQRELLLTPLAVIGGTVLLLHGMHSAISFITKQGQLGGKRKKPFFLKRSSTPRSGLLSFFFRGRRSACLCLSSRFMCC